MHRSRASSEIYDVVFGEQIRNREFPTICPALTAQLGLIIVNERCQRQNTKDVKDKNQY